MKTYKVVFSIKHKKDLHVAALSFSTSVRDGFIYFYNEDDTKPVAVVNTSMMLSVKEE